MTFYYKYYIEIKNRGILTIICWCITTMICYFYKEILLLLFLETNDTYLTLTGEEESYFIFTNISEIFFVYVSLMFFISNQITLVIFIYHTILFFSTGLYKNEYYTLLYLFKTFLLTWLITLLFFNYFILPTSINFFLSFQKTNGTSFFFEAKLNEYFAYVSNLYLICLMNFQLFVPIVFSPTLLNNNVTTIRKLRKLFYLIFLIFATILSPPDIISQIILGASLISIYEIVFLSSMVNKAAN